jgi:hypothetical protein
MMRVGYSPMAGPFGLLALALRRRERVTTAPQPIRVARSAIRGFITIRVSVKITCHFYLEQ